MFRTMRRFKQQLADREAERILDEGTSGVLAVLGDDDYPYTVPLSYVYQPEQNRILFHCAREGHKLDAIRNHDKVSFCVIGQDRVVPQEVTTYYKSVVVFGRARILEGEEKHQAALDLGWKYSHDFPEAIQEDMERAYAKVVMIAIEIEHMTGKEARELMCARGADRKPDDLGMG